MCTATPDNSSAKKKKRICITTSVIPPLAAAPATERSERVGEEAEESQRQALCTYAPVPDPRVARREIENIEHRQANAPPRSGINDDLGLFQDRA